MKEKEYKYKIKKGGLFIMEINVPTQHIYISYLASYCCKDGDGFNSQKLKNTCNSNFKLFNSPIPPSLLLLLLLKKLGF